MRKMIVDLGSKNNENTSPQLTRLHNLLLMSIVDTTENYLSNVYRKYKMIKLRTSSVNSSSTLFSSSIHEMCNRVNRAKKQHLMLKSYLPGINISIFPNRPCNNIFSEN